ncbi:hypothetical protein [Actinoplanes friuliensis]|uniref:Uncharacterized protein n=1 Tax=Actinoplanes friuliensis DSM 7358 TaxID=1246995 RepID=U5W742_9ACTN|nr:hypothetical protein [Actinoplanes friuliensis]AGZ43805.1 hypothetical protein AFR_27720 [Actinoplanes friuliensis DSM 7358]
MREADRVETGRWLERHGLTGAEPTPLLATRLAVRRRARIADSLLLAGFLIGAALAHVSGRATSFWMPLLVVVLLSGQWLLGRWVRRADQRAGAQLSRRVAHPVQLGWRAVLGRPYAVFTVASFAAALVLAVSVLPGADPVLRYGAIVVLIGLTGAGAGTILQLRQVLASPAVAEDEVSLTADVVMRVEDVRALVTPSLVWTLPAIFLYGTSFGWWNVVALALVVVGAVVLGLLQHRTACVGAAARQALAAR